MTEEFYGGQNADLQPAATEVLKTDPPVTQPQQPTRPAKIGLHDCSPNDVVQVDTEGHKFEGDAGRVLSVDRPLKMAVVHFDTAGEQLISWQDLRRLGGC